ncbi:putative alpha-galactosidase B [Grifola frondosa]|uniref:Alpha-galactosidase n=1 Tax=Grifola frondosa TaxID=5627 RepID=A0A1C7LX79_GRIFR|nr:putative alpha-galactosidase B [Grifola frondosa]
MKSPLLVGTNLSAITQETLEILTNKDILAINQDSVVGTSISPFRWGINPDWTSNDTFPAQYWSGPSENGTVFMLLNTLNEPATMFFNLTESPWIRAGRQYSVRDLWSHTDNGTAVRNFTATNVPPHGVVALLLKDAGNEPDGIYPACAVCSQFHTGVSEKPRTNAPSIVYKDLLGDARRVRSYRTPMAMMLLTLVVATLFSYRTECFGFFTTHPTAYVINDDDTLVGRLPVMGYNTWNAYHCDINETIILQTAQLMKSLGLADVGYTHVNIDDCYSEKNRSASGDIVADRVRFASGMNFLTDHVHALGLKAGIYSDSGWFTCQLYPGSFQNEARDAKLFQDWGFDYLKYDNCAIPFDQILREGIVGKYQRMADAIKDLAQSSGKPPLMFSLCEWGQEQPWFWAKRFGQSWRTTGDIGPEWSSIVSIINQNSFITWASDFYGHNDMDILEVGNGDLTFEEAKSHFTAWALMKSPLLIGTDLSHATQETLEILTNTEIIAVNQDDVVGTSVSPFRWGINPDWVSNATHPAQYWSGESKNGTVFMLLNTMDEPADMFFNLTESPWIRAGRQYAVRDLWAHTDNGTAIRNFTATAVPPHGVVALLLKDAGDEPSGIYPPCARPEWCMNENAEFEQPLKSTTTMMHGLVAYDDDDQSDHGDHNLPSTSSAQLQKSNIDDKPLKSFSNATSESPHRATPAKPQVIIRRAAHIKPHPRARLSDDQHDESITSSAQDAQMTKLSESVDTASLEEEDTDALDELTRIRKLLRPPPIPGLDDWGIPPEPTGPCDEAIEAKLVQFLALKRDPVNPRHFQRLAYVEQVLPQSPSICEAGGVHVKEEWYAGRIAEYQKARSEQQAAAQSSGKRTQIDFASSSSSAQKSAKTYHSSSSHRPTSKEAAELGGGRQSRFQPYAGTQRHGDALGSGYGKGRERSRWG